jgi:hypothetical protein
LTRAEFSKLLNTYFAHTLMLGQRPMLGSALMPEAQEGSASSLITFERRDETHFELSKGLPRPIYLVAVCSDAPIEARIGSLYIETSALDGLFSRLFEAERQSQNLSVEVRSLQLELTRGEALLSELRRQLDNAAEWSRSVLEARVHAHNQDSEVAWLRAELQARNDERRLLLGSRSWKLTAPLRAVTHDQLAGKRTGSVLKSVYRVLTDRGSRFDHGIGSRVTTSGLESIPAGAKVLVACAPHSSLPVDDRLSVRPFPQLDTGDYAGDGPSDSLAAIAHLEALRADGHEYFVFPPVAGWWPSQYPAFYRHLLRHYRQLANTSDGTTIFALREPPQQRVRSSIGLLEDAFAELDTRCGPEYAILDWGTNLDLAMLFPQRTIFSPPENRSALPYLDGSVDVVAIGERPATRAREARRVASTAVVTFTDGPSDSGAQLNARIEWLSGSQTRAVPSASILVAGGTSQLLGPRLVSIANSLPAEFHGELLLLAPPVSDGLQPERLLIQRNNLQVRRIEALEAATSASQYEALVFVGCDALPLPDWLPALLNTLCRFPDAAIVGGRIVDWNGRLIEAGGAISDSGAIRAIGARHSQPDDPAYSCLRLVDWCSRDLMATWRTTFQTAGGFDSSYRSTLLQDAEFCARARNAGKQVYYQPESIAVKLRVNYPPQDEGDRVLFAERWATSAGLTTKA